MKELGDLMLRRRFLIKADRMFKKPKPGRKRLVKWPKKLVPAENPLVSLVILKHDLAFLSGSNVHVSLQLAERKTQERTQVASQESFSAGLLDECCHAGKCTLPMELPRYSCQHGTASISNWQIQPLKNMFPMQIYPLPPLPHDLRLHYS